MTERLAIPGFVNAHTHTFQRELRGRGGGADFWAWRDGMLAAAERQTPELVRSGYAASYREMRAAGYTAVGEFHYLGLEEARAAVEAAAEAEVACVLLHVAYARGGLPRFRQESPAAYLREVETLRGEGARVGVAPHSVRACPPAWLEEVGRYAAAEGLPLHVHACEQPREVEECLAEHGCRPIELLARCGCLGPQTTVVHATHADGAELDLLRDAGARICACPTTEAFLGDGFLPVARVCHRALGVCIGSDSNVRVDPLEELRELEGIGRRQTGTRGVVSLDALLSFGSDEGAAALGLEQWPDVEVELGHAALRGVAREDVLDALVFSCAADVFAAPDDAACLRSRRPPASRRSEAELGAVDRGLLEPGLVALEPRHVQDEVQVAGRARDERVPLARLEHEHVSRSEHERLLLDAHGRAPAGDEVDLGDPLVQVRLVEALVGEPDRDGQLRVPGAEVPALGGPLVGTGEAHAREPSR